MHGGRKLIITYNELLVYAMFIAVFRPYLLPNMVLVVGRILLLALVLAFLFIRMPVKKLWNASLVICFAIFLSCAVNYGNHALSLQNLMNGIQYAACLYCMYTVIQYCSERGSQEKMIGGIYKITFVYCLISAVSILTGGNGQENTTYFFGSKFFTSYFFILLSGLFYLRFSDKIYKFMGYRIRLLILGFISVLMISLMECGTGLVAYVLLFTISFIPPGLRKNFKRPIVILALVVVSMLVLLIILSILQNSIVKYIIVNLLQRDLNLTDRLRYYAKAADVFRKGNFFFGYGYASSLMIRAIGLGTNIQNGLLQYIIMYGVVGAAAFLWEVFYCTKKGNQGLDCWGLYMVLYAMIIAATVEVSYNTVFFLSIFMIRWYGQGKYRQKRGEDDGSRAAEKLA